MQVGINYGYEIEQCLFYMRQKTANYTRTWIIDVLGIIHNTLVAINF